MAHTKSCFSDTAVVIIIKSGKSCSVGSFSTMLLWHCVYQIKTTHPWIHFWPHLHGKQVYECNELLLAPLQLLMETKITLVLQPKESSKTGMGNPHTISPFQVRSLERFMFNKSDIWFAVHHIIYSRKVCVCTWWSVNVRMFVLVLKGFNSWAWDGW